MGIGLAVWVMGCGPSAAVQLLTGASSTCAAGPDNDYVLGSLSAGPASATMIRGPERWSIPANVVDDQLFFARPSVVAVMWPEGYTGRWVGGQIEVLDVD